MSAAGGGPPGGIGEDLFCMRESESCASFLVGSSCEVAMRSAYVTSPASAPGAGGSEWQDVQFPVNIVETSQGTPVAGPPPAELPLDPPVLPAPLEPVEPPEPLLKPLEPPGPFEPLEPFGPPEDENDPGDASSGPPVEMMITFSSTGDEQAPAMARTVRPNTEGRPARAMLGFTRREVSLRLREQADRSTIFVVRLILDLRGGRGGVSRTVAGPAPRQGPTRTYRQDGDRPGREDPATIDELPECDRPPVAFLQFLKDLHRRSSEAVTYYFGETWGGDFEGEWAWVFAEQEIVYCRRSRNETVEIDRSGRRLVDYVLPRTLARLRSVLAPVPLE
jgi:hypothetical protein